MIPSMMPSNHLKYLVDKYGSFPWWGVVSTWAADSFYQGLTYKQALAKASEEAEEPGRDAVVVLMIQGIDGPPINRPKNGSLPQEFTVCCQQVDISNVQSADTSMQNQTTRHLGTAGNAKSNSGSSEKEKPRTPG